MKFRTVVTMGITALLLITQSIFHSSDAQPVVPDDSLALVALYENTGGENWHNNSNWLEQPVHTWYGVEDVGEDGRVLRLILGDNNLSGQIPAEIGALSSLERLELDGNRLSGTIPDLTGMKSLERMQLGGNDLSGEIPQWFDQLSELEDLRLWDLNFDPGPIPDLRSLAHIEDIRLINTNRTGEIPAWLGDLSYLSRLELNDNELTGEIPSRLGDLGYLERLDLSGNDLTGAIPEELQKMGNLRQLDLNDNRLNGVLPGVVFQFIHLRKLEELDLSGNHFTGNIPAWIQDLGDIESLKIKEPVALFLTWQRDPTTTMTIDWHTVPDDESDPVLMYKKLGSNDWVNVQSSQHEFPHSDRTINRVELTGLEPATYYRFRMGEFERLYKFRTMPEDLSEQVRFLAGGDTSHEQHLMSAIAMDYDPDFIVWGGDYAYSDGDPIWLYRWYGFFEGIRNNLISENGRVVPIVPAIGNHEIFTKRNLLRGRNVHHEHTVEEAREYMEKHNLWDRKVTFFFDLFAFPGDPAYNVLDFSDYLSLVLLDSGIDVSVDGEQKIWLRNTLQERVDVPHVFPVYHNPAYPTYRDFDNPGVTSVRENWVPIFEEYGVRVAFEHHDHTYKRTHRIRNGQVDENGVVYIGDGNWGRSLRRVLHSDAWYLKNFARARHGIVVTLDGERQHYLAVDELGNVIDEYVDEKPRN